MPRLDGMHLPLPRIEESLDALRGACWFSTVDLASGNNQVPVTEGDKEKTTFAPHLACSNGTECLWVVQCPLYLPATYGEVIRGPAVPVFTLISRRYCGVLHLYC